MERRPHTPLSDATVPLPLSMTSSDLVDLKNVTSLKVVVFAPRVVGKCLGYPRHQDTCVNEVDDLHGTASSIHDIVSFSNSNKNLLKFNAHCSGTSFTSLHYGRWIVLIIHCCRNRQHCCQKRQQCRSNARLCQNIRAKFYDELVRFWQQSRTLLWHCCWCRRGLTRGITNKQLIRSINQSLSQLVSQSIDSCQVNIFVE